jgi:putative endonuclease
LVGASGKRFNDRPRNKDAPLKPKYLRMLAGLKNNGDADWFVYIVRCADGTLYTGVTKALDARVAKHNAGTGAAYTRMHGPVALDYNEAGLTRSAALVREAAIKRLSRRQKEALILPPAPPPTAG